MVQRKLVELAGDCGAHHIGQEATEEIALAQVVRAVREVLVEEHDVQLAADDDVDVGCGFDRGVDQRVVLAALAHLHAPCPCVSAPCPARTPRTVGGVLGTWHGSRFRSSPSLRCLASLVLSSAQRSASMVSAESMRRKRALPARIDVIGSTSVSPLEPSEETRPMPDGVGSEFLPPRGCSPLRLTVLSIFTLSDVCRTMLWYIITFAGCLFDDPIADVRRGGALLSACAVWYTCASSITSSTSVEHDPQVIRRQPRLLVQLALHALVHRRRRHLAQRPEHVPNLRQNESVSFGERIPAVAVTSRDSARRGLGGELLTADARLHRTLLRLSHEVHLRVQRRLLVRVHPVALAPHRLHLLPAPPLVVPVVPLHHRVQLVQEPQRLHDHRRRLRRGWCGPGQRREVGQRLLALEREAAPAVGALALALLGVERRGDAAHRVLERLDEVLARVDVLAEQRLDAVHVLEELLHYRHVPHRRVHRHPEVLLGQPLAHRRVVPGHDQLLDQRPHVLDLQLLQHLLLLWPHLPPPRPPAPTCDQLRAVHVIQRPTLQRVV
eukprot:3939215-Rhodomonas_salina.2